MAVKYNREGMEDGPQTGPEAIEYALQQLDLDQIEKEAYDTIKEGKKTKRPKAVALLKIVQGMRRNEQVPSDYMIHNVPVIPPQFRPFAAQGGTFIPGDANVLYKDLWDIKEAHEEEKKVLGEKHSGQSRLDLYDAIRSVYGFGDAVKPKTKAKDIKGFLHTITGSTSKFGFVNRKLLSKTQDNTGRSTIIVEPDYGIDEIGIPEKMAFRMFSPYIQRRLKMSGMTDAEALKHTKEQDDAAKRALEKEMEVRPVVYSRAPAWHKFSVLAGHAKLVDGNAIKTNPYVAKGLGADYDGNCIIGCSKLLIKVNNNELAAKYGSDTISEIRIEDMPFIASTERTDKNGALVYDVPEGIEVLAATPEGGVRWEKVETFTKEEGCVLKKVTTTRGTSVTCSSNESLATFNPESGLKRIKPEDAIVYGVNSEGETVQKFAHAVPIVKRIPTKPTTIKNELEDGWLIGAFVYDGNYLAANKPCCASNNLVPLSYYALTKLEAAYPAVKNVPTSSSWRSNKSKAKAYKYDLFSRDTVQRYAALIKEHIADWENDPALASVVNAAFDEDVTWARYKSVEDAPTETVYDIGVPGAKVFMLSSGMIVYDTINVHVPASDAAVKEAKEVLMPSTFPFSNRDQDKLVPLPKQEQVLGLYTAATAPATKPIDFPSEQAAMQAIRTGQVPLSADITINGKA